MSYFSQILRFLIIKIIKVYQKTISFDHGVLRFLYPHGFCRFQPTCSQYAIESIERFGAIRGGFKALGRILRCNPFNKGGWDPVK